MRKLKLLFAAAALLLGVASASAQATAVSDGKYCLYDATSKLFLGRGCNRGVEAALDKYGIPFNLRTDASGVSSFEFVDWTGVYLFLSGSGTSIFTDNASTGWKLVPTTGGYYLKTADGTYYVAHANGDNGEYAYATTEETSATVWTLMTTAERDAIIAAYPTENINNVIAAAGISTTAEDFEDFLSDENHYSVDLTDNIGTAIFDGFAGDWTFSEVRHQNGQPAYGENFCEAWNATGSWTQTITDLPKGIYKLTVSGFERRRDQSASYSLGKNGYNLVSSNIVANGEQVRFASWFDAADSNYNPSNTDQVVDKFEDGKYLNELYTYVGDDGKLTITINKPNYLWDCWLVFNNFTLIRYIQVAKINEDEAYTPEAADLVYVELKRALSVDNWNTFVVPFDISNEELKETFGDNVQVAEYSEVADGDNSIVNFNMMDIPAIAANTPVLLKPAIINTTYNKYCFDDRTIVTGDAKVEGAAHFDFVGTYAASTTIAAGDYFISSSELWKSEGATTIKGTRAYIKVKDTEAGARIVGFSLDGVETTAIMDVERGTITTGNVYNMAGQQVKKAQKGIYIQNGKKVVVK